MSVSQNFENSQLKQQLLLEMWKKKNIYTDFRIKNIFLVKLQYNGEKGVVYTLHLQF